MTLEIDTYKWDSMCIIGGGTDIYEQVGGGGADILEGQGGDRHS